MIFIFIIAFNQFISEKCCYRTIDESAFRIYNRIEYVDMPDTDKLQHVKNFKLCNDKQHTLSQMMSNTYS